MILFFYLLVLVLSFYLLAVICDRYFISSLDKIAERLKMNSDMAGATLMAAGSSAPELFVALIALFKPGNEAMGAGTIVGSAVFNILVIIGASAMVKRALISWQPVVRDLAFYSISIILLLVFFHDGNIGIGEALIFVGVYVVYVLAVLNWQKILPYKDNEKIEDLEEEEERSLPEKSGPISSLKLGVYKVMDFIFPKKENYWTVFILSVTMIAGLAYILVESAVIIAGILNIPSVIIGLTVLAIGTSIPDLVSSLIVAKQGRGGMAISNAIGSNIFDILIGLGLPWLLVIVVYGHNITVVTENLVSSVILLLATVVAILFLLIMRHWRLGKYSGLLLIGLYVAYLSWAVLQAI